MGKKKKDKKKKDNFFKKYLRKRKRQNTTIESKAIRSGAALWSIMSLPIVLIDPTGISAAVTIGGYGLLGASFGGVLAIGDDRKKLEKGALSHYSFKGKNKDIISIATVQFLIEEINQKYKNYKELPDNIKEEIALHIKDIQPILKKVRIFEGDKEVREINFVRPYKDQETFRNVLQLISSHPENGLFFNSKDLWLIPKLTISRLNEIQKRKKEKKKSEQFNSMAKKIEELEKRLDEKENPKPKIIDKPRYKKNH